MTLQIPPFMNLDHNEAGRRATLTVEDENIKHQKAMWGRSSDVRDTKALADFLKAQPVHTCKTT
jgi:hypothetical protein